MTERKETPIAAASRRQKKYTWLHLKRIQRYKSSFWAATVPSVMGKQMEIISVHSSTEAQRQWNMEKCVAAQVGRRTHKSFPHVGDVERKESLSRWGRAQAGALPGTALEKNKCEEHSFRNADPCPGSKAPRRRDRYCKSWMQSLGWALHVFS